MLPVIILLLLLGGGYVLSTYGCARHPDMDALRGWAYAHRGLHDGTRPENSMDAFRAAVDAGYGMELDVHLLSDGTLAVMHDSLLRRTTGAEGRIEDLTRAQLSQYFLAGSQQTIPTLNQVLELVDGRVPLIIELKAVDGNHNRLTETACDVLENYQGTYCMESFDPRCIFWLRRHRPHIIRGQLSENALKTKSPIPWILRFIMTHQMVNFLTCPHFVAYRYEDRRNLGNFLVRKLWGVQGVSWTLQSKQQYDTALQEGWLPIFENFTP